MDVDGWYTFAGLCIGIIYWQSRSGEGDHPVSRVLYFLMFALFWPLALGLYTLHSIPLTRPLIEWYLNSGTRRDE